MPVELPTSAIDVFRSQQQDLQAHLVHWIRRSRTDYRKKLE